MAFIQSLVSFQYQKALDTTWKQQISGRRRGYSQVISGELHPTSPRSFLRLGIHPRANTPTWRLSGRPARLAPPCGSKPRGLKPDTNGSSLRRPRAFSRKGSEEQRRASVPSGETMAGGWGGKEIAGKNCEGLIRKCSPLRGRTR